MKAFGSKKGFTMTELLVVVAIMGILSSMGVVSLHGAVVNNRVRDAAVNVTAYLERVASETNRLSQKVCVSMDASLHTIYAYKGECSPSKEGPRISEYSLEGALQFKLNPSNCCTFGAAGAWWEQGGAQYEPRFGLSAMPLEGCVVVQYGNSDKMACAMKKKEKNNAIPRVSYDNGSTWTNL